MSNITVVIANKDYGIYIKDAINSCFNQTIRPFCVIIVDDCSQDDSWNNILSYFPSKKFITENGLQIFQEQAGNTLLLALRLNKTSGPSLTRNIAIDITKNFTDLYQILDADDIMYSNKLEVLSNKINSGPIGLVYADYDILNIHTGNILREWKYPYSKRHLMQECIVHSGFMVKKQVLLDTYEPTGYYDINLRCVEDWDLELRISDKNAIIHIPQSLTLVRVHSNNSTYSVKNEIWQQCWQRVAQKTKQRQGR